MLTGFPESEDLALPRLASASAEIDVYAAVREFVLAYALPALDPEHVFQGRLNRSALPPETNEYATISIIRDKQRGTTVEALRPVACGPGQGDSELGNSEQDADGHDGSGQNDDGHDGSGQDADGQDGSGHDGGNSLAPESALTVSCLRELQVQVDFCSESDLARQRAMRLALVARSSAGVRFFHACTKTRHGGLSPLYAGDVRDTSFVDESRQFVRRCSVVLHLSAWAALELDQPYFETARLARIENVEVHHPE